MNDHDFRRWVRTGIEGLLSRHLVENHRDIDVTEEQKSGEGRTAKAPLLLGTD